MHLSHLGMCRKGIFSELLFHFFQLPPLFEGCLTNLSLDFLTWHIVCSIPFKKKSFWIYKHHTLTSTLWELSSIVLHDFSSSRFKGILKNWQKI